MAVISVLSEVLDKRKGSKDCFFNGFLEDYLNSDDGLKNPYREQLLSLFEDYPDLRVMVDYRFNVHKKAITNQIIRYRDVYKLPDNYFDFGLILYGQFNDREIAILIGEGDRPVDYYLARGMFYCMTEQYGLLEEYRYDSLVITSKHIVEIKSYLSQLSNRTRLTKIQSQLDSQYFKNFEDLGSQVMALAQGLNDSLVSDIEANKNDKGYVVYRNVAACFLFKKLLYVQYMTNKALLNSQAEGNIKKHRTNAKEYIDQVPFTPFRMMWNAK